MRGTSAYLKALWGNGGPFIGADRAHARVTVENDWSLHLVDGVSAPDPTKLPFRWFQRADNSQVETEVPNVASIGWDRSLDSDAASCNITIYNQKMDPNLSGQNRRLGQRGHYTWRQRGMNATARWPESTNNEWTEVLIPNALLRTYEGFGGHDKSLEDAVADGNLYLTGLWLIDEVRVGTDGNLQLTGRDMSKLLLEQQLYIPLMPIAKYPLHYYKWRHEVTNYPSVPYYDRVDPGVPDGPFFGPGSEGRKWVPDIGLDVDGEGYAILGTDGGVFCYETSFFGSRGQGAIQGIVGLAKRPQGDGYWAVDSSGQVFSHGAAANHGSPSTLLEPIVRMAATSSGNGYWLLDRTGDIIPFGDAFYFGSVPDDAAPFVDLEGTDNGAGYWLLSNTGAVYAYGNAGYHGNATIAVGQTASGFAARPNSDGYWICATDGAVYAMGGASYHGRVTNPNAPICAIVSTSTGNGYWLLGQDGGVFSFGDATFHGSMPPATPSRDMAATDDGYWVIAETGAIETYGTVTDYGSPTPAVDPTPMRGLAMDPLGRGYWLCAEDGAVYAFGDAAFYGRVTNPNEPIIRIVATPNGRGYWLLGEDGGIFAFGNAGYFGNAIADIVGTAVDMARTSTGAGYWVLSNTGAVYAYGDADYFGGGAVTPPDLACGIAARTQDDGYWVVSANGGIFAMGAAPFQPANGDFFAFKAALNDPITGIDASKTGLGYVLVAGDGGVFSFGDAPFEGSLPASFMRTRQFPGNYEWLEDIVIDMLLWSGWWLYGSTGVFGNIESTGVFVEEEIPADTFDKRPVIDAINAIRDIVGYEFWIDEEGGARFESPNFYTYGNHLEFGQPTDVIPEIDERHTLTSYQLSYVDRPIRSEIIITSDDPNLHAETTITTIRPITSNLLRGMVKPAMIPTPFNVSKTDQELMAELIEQHMHFQTLQGSITCVANPAIQLNDQVRVLEQITGETDVHYVRGVSSQHDLNSGIWTYTLTTNHLGAGRGSAVTGAITPVAPSVATASPPPVQAAPVVALARGAMIGWYDGSTSQYLADGIALGKGMAIQRIYHTEAQWGTVKSDVGTCLARGDLPLASWKAPDDGGEWGLCANGAYNSDLESMANTFKTLGTSYPGKEIIFVFHHEPHDNSTLKPGGTSGTPAQFVAAFRHVKAYFEAEGVTNLRYGYCAVDSWADNLLTSQGDPLYPGNSYVDVLCHDYYNWEMYNPSGGDWASGSHPWKDPATKFAPLVALAKLTNKPVIPAEIGCHPSASGHTRDQWFRDLAKYMKGQPSTGDPTGDPSIPNYFIGFCYYHVDSHGGSAHYWGFLNGGPYDGDGTQGWIDAFVAEPYFKAQAFPIGP